MKNWFVFLLLAAGALSAPAAAQVSAASPVAAIGDGRIAGTAFPGGSVFFNIPFASAPVGDLRWRPPVSSESWDGLRDGTRRGAACMQPDQGWNAVDAERSSEDCLYVNVWRPEGSGSHAVMVWFHGGGFVGGAGNTPLYDGEDLARRGIVLVAVNYRLGVFGYLAHPDLAGESQHGISGNYGLMDQIAALQWVQQNIASFGGDPSKVTIFGQSAGAASVAYLMASPKTDGLFQRAILQSGAPFGSMLGTTPRLDEAQMQNAQFGAIADLRHLSALDILDRWTQFAPSSGPDLRLAPVVDGETLITAAGDALMEGAARDIEVIVGSNSREMPSTLSAEGVQEAARIHFGSQADDLLRTYADRADDARYGSLADQLGSDLAFGCPVISMAESVANAWVYSFGQPSPGDSMVRHSSELSYVFGLAGEDDGVLTQRPFNQREEQLSGVIQDYWSNFARSGNPNGDDLPIWPKFVASEAVGAVFSEGTVVAGPIASPACQALGGEARQGS